MKVYLAGPMTGIPQFNYPAFISAAQDLRGVGLDVVSPAELDDPEDVAAAMASPNGLMSEFNAKSPKTWGQFLSRDVELIADGGIEAIYVLANWEDSRGARLETFVAKAMCGLPIFKYEGNAPYGFGGEVSAVTLVRAWAGGLWSEVQRMVVGRVYDGLASLGVTL